MKARGSEALELELPFDEVGSRTQYGIVGCDWCVQCVAGVVSRAVLKLSLYIQAAMLRDLSEAEAKRVMLRQQFNAVGFVTFACHCYCKSVAGDKSSAGC